MGGFAKRKRKGGHKEHKFVFFFRGRVIDDMSFASVSRDAFALLDEFIGSTVLLQIITSGAGRDAVFPLILRHCGVLFLHTMGVVGKVSGNTSLDP